MRVISRFIVTCLALGAATVTAGAQTANKPALHLHQDYIEESARQTELNVKDPLAVFGFVLNSLPDRVKVYPTENYFYFTFTHNSVPYAGNVRLDASNRDDGKVQFGYFEQTTEWLQETPTVFRELSAADGVKLEKVERFLYRLSYGGKSVLFELNDLSGVKPPAAALGPREKFIGPVFDDSGIRFFLVYQPQIKNFLFVLDETVRVADELSPSPRDERLTIGKRTGFVYYRDKLLERKILVGVFENNVNVNNYFDGPFDQLPDNFIEGETLRDAILDIQPNLKGKIDRFGGTPDGEVRYAISPYRAYKTDDDFDGMLRCARRKGIAAAAYYKCFVISEGPQNLDVRPAPENPPIRLKSERIASRKRPPARRQAAKQKGRSFLRPFHLPI
jgi:hypothetical protein